MQKRNISLEKTWKKITLLKMCLINPKQLCHFYQLFCTNYDDCCIDSRISVHLFYSKDWFKDALQLHLCESTWEMTQHWKLLAWRYEVHHDGGVKTH